MRGATGRTIKAGINGRTGSATRALVVIPAHNEEETIREVVTRSLKHADVSVTDDGSRDETLKILEGIKREADRGKHGHRLNIVKHPQATHIPRAVQDGLKWGAAQRQYDYFITMDAGLSHDPDALPDFLAADPGAEVVIGSRRRPENVPAYRRLVSRLGALVINYALSESYLDVAGPRLRDCTSGFRRYSRRAAEAIAAAELRSRAFDFHMEALALCLRRGMRAAEIPITYVFSNSSFNRKVLWQAMKFGWRLIRTK
ncbi:MAG: glycosyltransferase [Candidatus Aminicenantes bacterium]|nr:glycosyltransferase [Candidatus Aminicenantes bacterium]